MKNMMNTKNLLSLAVGLGIAYYFFAMKPKKNKVVKEDE